MLALAEQLRISGSDGGANQPDGNDGLGGSSSITGYEFDPYSGDIDAWINDVD